MYLQNCVYGTSYVLRLDGVKSMKTAIYTTNPCWLRGPATQKKLYLFIQ